MTPSRLAVALYPVAAVAVWTALGVEAARDDGGPPPKLQLAPWVKVVLIGVAGLVCAAPVAVVGYVIGLLAMHRWRAKVRKVAGQDVAGPSAAPVTPGAAP